MNRDWLVPAVATNGELQDTSPTLQTGNWDGESVEVLFAKPYHNGRCTCMIQSYLCIREITSADFWKRSNKDGPEQRERIFVIDSE